jgi:hypothetical protein
MFRQDAVQTPAAASKQHIRVEAFAPWVRTNPPSSITMDESRDFSMVKELGSKTPSHSRVLCV